MEHRDPSDDDVPPPLWPSASRRGSSSGSGADQTGDEPDADGDNGVGSAAGVTGSSVDSGVADPPSRAASEDLRADAAHRRRSADTRDGSGAGASTFLRELPVLILVAFVLAFLLRTFVVQVFFIPSSSMEPTLQIDDRMAVEKITFRFREPRRGDIVVFEEGDTSLTDPTGGDRFLRGVGQFLGLVPASARDFVKRVIATGGDEVRIEEGQVYVNDVPFDEPYVVFPDNDNYGPVTVPDNHLFFLGDNRPNSSDSRRSLGFVPNDAVVGRAVVIIWPLENWDSLTGVEHDVEAPANP